MPDPAPRGPSLAFLVVSWVVLLVLGLNCAAFAIWVALGRHSTPF